MGKIRWLLLILPFIFSSFYPMEVDQKKFDWWKLPIDIKRHIMSFVRLYGYFGKLEFKFGKPRNIYGIQKIIHSPVQKGVFAVGDRSSLKIVTYDIKNPKINKTVYLSSFSDEIADFAWHPTKPDRLAVYLKNGYLRIFDWSNNTFDAICEHNLNAPLTQGMVRWHPQAEDVIAFTADNALYFLKMDKYCPWWGWDFDFKINAIDWDPSYPYEVAVGGVGGIVLYDAMKNSKIANYSFLPTTNTIQFHPLGGILCSQQGSVICVHDLKNLSSPKTQSFSRGFWAITGLAVHKKRADLLLHAGNKAVCLHDCGYRFTDTSRGTNAFEFVLDKLIRSVSWDPHDPRFIVIAHDDDSIWRYQIESEFPQFRPDGLSADPLKCKIVADEYDLLQDAPNLTPEKKIYLNLLKNQITDAGINS